MSEVNVIINGNQYLFSENFNRDSLCTQNKSLLDEIERKMRVLFIQENSFDSWASICGRALDGSPVGVVFMVGDYDDCFAAHELLHLKCSLSVDHGVLCKMLFDAASEDKRLADLFTEETVSMISNNADHLITFHQYCDMGLPEERFFYEHKSQEINASDLAERAISNKKPGDVLSALMMILFHPKKEKWSNKLKALKKLSPDLYKTCNDFRERIIASAMANNMQSAQEQAYSSFVKSLKLWYSSNGVR